MSDMLSYFEKSSDSVSVDRRDLVTNEDFLGSVKIKIKDNLRLLTENNRSFADAVAIFNL